MKTGKNTSGAMSLRSKNDAEINVAQYAVQLMIESLRLTAQQLGIVDDKMSISSERRPKMEFGIRDIYDDEERLEQADTQDMGGEAGDTPKKRPRKSSKASYNKRQAKKPTVTATTDDTNTY